jgi:patatin-like phospholipase domain-containing protein 2
MFLPPCLTGLTKVLPEDIHLRATGRLHISVTRLADRKNLIINRFESRDHLIDALLASRDESYKDNYGENK